MRLLAGDRDGPRPSTSSAPEPTPAWRSFRRWPVWAQGVVWIAATLVAVEALVPAAADPADAGAADGATTTIVEPTTTLTQPPTIAEPTGGAASPSTGIPPTTEDATATPGSSAPGARLALPAGVDSTVTAHVDGDTLKVATGETIRIIGVDTPETKHPSEPVECHGAEASAYTAERFPVGTRVRLVHDVERTDRYGRTLAYVYRADDGLFLNLALVRDGFAQVSTYPPNVAHVDELVAAQREAREGDRGLWDGACERPAPTSTPPSAAGAAPYSSCAAARADGAAPVLRTDARYGPHLDGDSDGIGCE